MLTFGAGRRACLGEVLAKNRLFLMVTAIFQQFQLLAESAERKPEHDPRNYCSGFNIYPKPYKVLLKYNKD